MELLSLFATAPRGMSDLLAAELLQLGAESASETGAGVAFRGTLETAYRACLWSRLANRILLPLARFEADSPEALYAGVRRIDWSAHLLVSQTLAVDANVSASTITHSHYAALKIKDAIVDAFTADGGERPNVDVDEPDVRINCYLQRDRASLYLDLSGTSLHRRGYRLDSGEAPLKENLAAALLLRARWPEVAADGGAFVDPMCGAGTLPIEAAMMAGDIAPGMLRGYFGFTSWKQHRRDIWQRLVAEAEYRRKAGRANLPPILGFDVNRKVLALARDNAGRAGVMDDISFAYQDIFDFRHDFPARGLLVSNPPYGRRLAESGELPALYRALGDVLREKFRGWRAAVFTEDQALGKHIGIKASKLNTLFNGAISCKLIQFRVEESEFYNDHRLPRRLADTDLSAQAGMFRNRLVKNLKQLRRWTRREGISCYRVYDADLPDYAGAIDVYRNADAPQEHWVCVQEYEAPRSVDEHRARLRTREMLTVAQSVFAVDDQHLFYKTRSRQRGDSQYQRMNDRQRFHQVSEGECRFWVNFEDYLDTGLFLDHRPLRRRLFAESRDKRFLNLFGYTGTATVHAALGGASLTTTVDMSATYLDWARRNLELNRLDPERHRLVRADCLAWLAGGGDRQQYDLILLDPPTFSNSRRMNESFDVQRDHPELIALTMQMLRPGGTLYFSTNLRGFKLDDSVQGRFDAKDISGETIPPDFKRRKNTHHCWSIHARDGGGPAR